MPSERQSNLAPQTPRNIRRQTVVTRERTAGGTQETRTQYEDPESYRAPQARARGRVPRSRGFGGSVVRDGNSGVGLLMAEFVLTIGFLVLIFFTSQADFSTRIMSFVKRGTLTCLAFFLLALFSAIGPNTSKIAKGIGALMLVGIVLTTDLGTGLQDLDNLIKNDWAGSAATGTEKGAPASANPSNAPQSNPGTIQTLTQGELSKILHAAVGSPAYNAAAAELRAFKSGDVWKVPGDAVVALEDTGVHDIKKAASLLGDVLHFFGL